MVHQALFNGLVFDEQERLVNVAYIGSDAHYVVDDDGFHRHIEAQKVDREVLAVFISQLQQNRELAVMEALRFMGQDDLFTKAALESSIDHVDVDAILAQGIPGQARDMLGMMGFRIIIDHHGEIVDFAQPMGDIEGE